MNALSEQIEYVTSNIPYYQKLKLKKTDRFTDFPIIQKTEIKNNYSSFISTQFNDQKRELIKDLESESITKRYYVDEAFSNNIIIETTSGTTGFRFKCPKTIEERTRIGFTVWRQRWGVDPKINPKNFFAFHHTGQNEHPFDILDPNPKTIGNLYKYVANQKPRWLHAPPRMLKEEIKIINANDIKINLPELAAIECAGHFLDHTTKKEIEDFFNVMVVDQYGLIETWPIALTCRHGQFHLNANNVYLELIDENDDVIEEYNKSGRVVVTSLISKLLPFMRYLTGDYAYYEKKKCKCKLDGKCFTLLQGRESNLIKGKSDLTFGNLIFEQILGNLYRENDQNKNQKGFKAHTINFIQVVQTSENTFELYTNLLDQTELFYDRFVEHSKKLLGNDAQIKHIILKNIEIETKISLKPELFVRKC